MAFDATLVALAVALSLALLGRIEDVREGTLIGVFLVGWFVGLFFPRLRGLRKACFHWVSLNEISKKPDFPPSASFI